MARKKSQRLIKLIRRDKTTLVEVEADYILQDNEEYTQVAYMVDRDAPLHKWEIHNTEKCQINN